MKSPEIRRVLGYTGRVGIPGWWTFLIYVTDAAIGLRRVSKKKKKCGQKTLRYNVVALDHKKKRVFKMYRTRMYGYCSSLH